MKISDKCQHYVPLIQDPQNKPDDVLRLLEDLVECECGKDKSPTWVSTGLLSAKSAETAGWTILKDGKTKDGEDIVLAKRIRSLGGRSWDEYVTWKVSADGRSMTLGHYFEDKEKAEKDFIERISGKTNW